MTTRDVEKTTKITVDSLRVNRASIVSKYRRTPEEAQAIQFQGWENAPDVINFLPGVYYVPMGYPHALRYADEYAEDHKVLPNATEFLVFRGADESDYRIELGSYLIRTAKGQIAFYDAAQFKENYQENVL